MNGRVNLEPAQSSTGSFNQVASQFSHTTALNSTVAADLVRGNVEKKRG
jgi:hypothetical protein